MPTINGPISLKKGEDVKDLIAKAAIDSLKLPFEGTNLHVSKNADMIKGALEEAPAEKIEEVIAPKKKKVNKK